MSEAITPAGELRGAARRLRELAGPVPEEWRLVRSQIVAVGTDRLPGTDVIATCMVPDRAAFVASMPPPVPLAVADWLERTAADYEQHGEVTGLDEALAVARACPGTGSGQ